MQRTVSSTGGASVGKANEGLLVITQILRGVFNGLSRGADVSLRGKVASSWGGVSVKGNAS